VVGRCVRVQTRHASVAACACVWLWCAALCASACSWGNTCVCTSWAGRVRACGACVHARACIHACAFVQLLLTNMWARRDLCRGEECAWMLVHASWDSLLGPGGGAWRWAPGTALTVVVWRDDLLDALPREIAGHHASGALDLRALRLPRFWGGGVCECQCVRVRVRACVEGGRTAHHGCCWAQQ